MLTSRVRSPSLGSASPSSRLFWIAAALLVLNLLDGLFTLLAVYAGAADEANPLMQGPLAHGPVMFILTKTALVSLGVLLLWRSRQRLLAAGGLVALSVVYTGVLIYHVSAFQVVAHHVG